MEQVKVFTSSNLFHVHEGENKYGYFGLEPVVNQWLKEMDNKIEIIQRMFYVNDVEILKGNKKKEYIICIFYKEVK